jgi:hypothetical protein
VGKSTLLAEPARRGFATVDTDYGGWTGPDGLWDEGLDNPYGKKREQRAEIARMWRTAGRRADLADRVEELLGGTGTG